MKKIIPIISLMIIIAGCSAPKMIPSSNEYLTFDFRKYTKEGFLFTPEKLSGNYESIGILNIWVYPSARKLGESELGIKPAPGYYKENGFLIERLSPEKITDQIYNQAKEMGADAVMNLQFKPSDKQVNVSLTLHGFSISGFAVKRQK